MRLSLETCWEHLRAADHGVLSTLAPQHIDAVPVCFAVVDDAVASPVETVKAKETTELARLKNLDRTPLATLLCERWVADDWSQLWWVRARLHRLGDDQTGPAFRRQCEAALREKYSQYREVEFAHLLMFDVTSVSGWQAGEEAAP
ncbi:MAG TPA: hypothetical protein VN886_02680 [Acidimicrobiales bacterium]|nr:hypothetical protein [Acidimicrobiales bacterium]